MRHPSGEDRAAAEAELARQRAQPVFLRTAADQQDRDVRAPPLHQRDRPQQQVQSLIGVERAEKSEHPLAPKAEPGSERGIGGAGPAKGVAVDRVGDDRDLVVGDATGDDLAPQPFADCCHRVGAPQCAGFEEPCRAVAQPAGAVARGRVLPQAPDLIDDRNALAAAGADRRQGVQHRGMGVQNLRLDLADDLVQAAAEIADDLELAHPGQPGAEAARHPRAQIFPVADSLARRSRRVVLAARQQHRLPAEGPLLVDDAERAKDVAALQRRRMIEDV